MGIKCLIRFQSFAVADTDLNYKHMGRVKNLMMEMDEHGYAWFPHGEKCVCSNHFGDRYLNQYILERGDKGVCSYCGRRDTVIDMSDLANHIGMTISVYFNDVDSECLPLASSYYDEEDEYIPGIRRVGCFAVPENADLYEDTSEMMDDLGLHTDCEELNEDIDNFFGNYVWIKKDPFELWWNEKKEREWKNFAEKVKHSRRFTFLAERGDDGNILDELVTALRNFDSLVRMLPIDTTLFRARSVGKIIKAALGFEELTSAPDNSAGQCRMSPLGVSMFYAAFDKDTAVEECVKGAGGKLLVVGEFKTTRELSLVDLTALPNHVSIWMDRWESVAFLKSFHRSITQPLLENGKEGIEYVPSQIFTEYLRWMFRDKNGKKVDGLIYDSCKTSKSNVVLFCNNTESASWVRLGNSYVESNSINN